VSRLGTVVAGEAVSSVARIGNPVRPDLWIATEQNRRFEGGMNPAAKAHALCHEREVLQEQHRLVLGASLRVEAQWDRDCFVEELRFDPALAAAGEKQIEVIHDIVRTLTCCAGGPSGFFSM